tara:strand:- start:727 stop:3012 length:2286 start_codon:yes stop_codon:yes gene_type:complete
MKIILTFYLLLLTLTVTQAQIPGEVLDAETNASLQETRIYNLETNQVQITDDSGRFTLPSIGEYRFHRKGYVPTTLTINSTEFFTVQLNLSVLGLNEVIVNANQIPKTLKKAMTTIEVLSQKEINRGNDINIAQVLNRAPGIFMQSGALNTNRLTIRGIGSRTLYGTSKIRAYFKDIPLTNGSGETTIEDFELASISRIEVVKGAPSSVYGAGLGGVIHLTPKNATLNETSVHSQLTLGSFGLLKSNLNFNHGSANNSYRGVYSNTYLDGYRDNNQYNRQTFTLATNHYVDAKNELSIIASYVDLKAFIPSSVNESTFLNSPTDAAFTWGKSKGFEKSKRGLLGVTWSHDYHQKLKQITSVFGSFREGYEPRPFNVLEEHTMAYGMRSRLLGTVQMFENPLNFTVGGDYFKDHYRSQTFQNLYEDFPDGIGSVKGASLSDFNEDRSYYNVFLETNYELSKKTSVEFGLNYNQTIYNLKDNFIASEENPDQSGAYRFRGILSPKMGVSFLASNEISLYSTVSHGFSPISLAETLLPNGQINTNLKPETGWNYEVGTRGTLFQNKLQFNVALYRLDIRNLVVSRRIANDQYIGINAGQTRHDGFEIGLNYSWVDTKQFVLNTFINGTLNHFKFKQFIDGDDDFSGNDLTGVPSELVNAGIDFTTEFGVYGSLNYQQVGSQPMSDSNQLYSDSYDLTNLKIGYSTDILEQLKMNLFVGVDNVFGESYASQILINARGFGGNAPRYYYPGAPVNYYTGIAINYIL